MGKGGEKRPFASKSLLCKTQNQLVLYKYKIRKRNTYTILRVKKIQYMEN